MSGGSASRRSTGIGSSPPASAPTSTRSRMSISQTSYLPAGSFKLVIGTYGGKTHFLSRAGKAWDREYHTAYIE